MRIEAAGVDRGAVLRAELSALGPVSVKVGQTLAQRLEFFNEWLPWKDQEVESGMVPSMTITLKWKIKRRVRNI